MLIVGAGEGALSLNLLAVSDLIARGLIGAAATAGTEEDALTVVVLARPLSAVSRARLACTLEVWTVVAG